jgi:hypothetical protein
MLHAPRDGAGPQAMIAAIRGLADQPPPSRAPIPGLLDGLDAVAERTEAAFAAQQAQPEAAPARRRAAVSG